MVTSLARHVRFRCAADLMASSFFPGSGDGIKLVDLGEKTCMFRRWWIWVSSVPMRWMEEIPCLGGDGLV